jgi:hypothetical protein
MLGRFSRVDPDFAAKKIARLSTRDGLGRVGFYPLWLFNTSIAFCN